MRLHLFTDYTFRGLLTSYSRIPESIFKLPLHFGVCILRIFYINVCTIRQVAQSKVHCSERGKTRLVFGVWGWDHISTLKCGIAWRQQVDRFSCASIQYSAGYILGLDSQRNTIDSLIKPFFTLRSFVMLQVHRAGFYYILALSMHRSPQGHSYLTLGSPSPHNTRLHNHRKITLMIYVHYRAGPLGDALSISVDFSDCSIPLPLVNMI